MPTTLDILYLREKLAEEFKENYATNETKHYLNAQQRVKHLVQFDNDGNLLDQENNKLSGNYIYTMASDGRLYAAKESIVRHHSYFVAGDNIICAGILKIENGRLVNLDNNSGHYKPSVADLKDVTTRLQPLVKTMFTCYSHCSKPVKSCNSAELINANSIDPMVPVSLFSSYATGSRFNAVGLNPRKSKLYLEAERLLKLRKSNESSLSSSGSSDASLELANSLLSNSAASVVFKDEDRIILADAHQQEITNKAANMVCFYVDDDASASSSDTADTADTADIATDAYEERLEPFLVDEVENDQHHNSSVSSSVNANHSNKTPNKSYSIDDSSSFFQVKRRKSNCENIVNCSESNSDAPKTTP